MAARYDPATVTALARAEGMRPQSPQIVGRVADTFDPRWALRMGAVAGFAAALVATWYLGTATPRRR